MDLKEHRQLYRTLRVEGGVQWDCTEARGAVHALDATANRGQEERDIRTVLCSLSSTFSDPCATPTNNRNYLKKGEEWNQPTTLPSSSAQWLSICVLGSSQFATCASQPIVRPQPSTLSPTQGSAMSVPATQISQTQEIKTKSLHIHHSPLGCIARPSGTTIRVSMGRTGRR